MKIDLEQSPRRRITEANINFYATPFVHPERIMDEHDFIYMLEGEWKIGQNSEIFDLKKDSLLILCGGQRHFGAAPCLKDTKTMYFHLSKEEGDGLKENGLDILIDAAKNRNIKRVFRDIVQAKLEGNEQKASVLFDLLLCELKEYENRNENDAIGERIKSIIHQNPEKFFSNKELAEKIGVSVKTVETKFNSSFGITLHQYILRFKCEQAVLYFRSFPEMQIKEVAYNLGFYDEYHFSKQFKKIMGVSPLIYRKSI